MSKGEMRRSPSLTLGGTGHLAVFLWALGLILLAPAACAIPITIAGLLVLTALYPFALRRLLRPRWLVMLTILFLATVAFGNGEPDFRLWGVSLSSGDLLLGLQMVLRGLLILVAADGLSASTDISELAGLFERAGLRGLSFSLGVAVNLLPALREAGTHAWHSLWMRGGLRARWGRGLQLLVLAILTNALRRADDIVLAAEARAFRPELSRRLPIRVGRWDWGVIALGLVSLIGLVIL